MLYNKIKEIAKSKKISINKLEVDCGFAQGSMCKWNNSSPSFKKIQKVAEYLEVDIKYFLED